MKWWYADTFYFLALVNERESVHELAVEHSMRNDVHLVTTWAVLLELADALCAVNRRYLALRLIDDFDDAASSRIIPLSEDLVRDGLRLYRTRPDKDWSLTDCISFVTMEEMGISEALTADKHFEQAGFRPLLKA